MLTRKPKLHTCKVKTCRVRYERHRPFETWCSPDCALILLSERKEKEEALRLKRERQEWREKVAEAKPISYWLKRAQTMVNALRREMDKDAPCYTCGAWETVQREASHYRSRGACSSARFDIARNLRTACHFCNVHLSGNLGVFRARLVQEIGESEVLALEAMPKSYRWTRDECQQIEADAKMKLRELMKVTG